MPGSGIRERGVTFTPSKITLSKSAWSGPAARPTKTARTPRSSISPHCRRCKTQNSIVCKKATRPRRLPVRLFRSWITRQGFQIFPIPPRSSRISILSSPWIRAVCAPGRARMGKFPGWVLLPFMPDWRWLLHREGLPLVSDRSPLSPTRPRRLGGRHPAHCERITQIPTDPLAMLSRNLAHYAAHLFAFAIGDLTMRFGFYSWIVAVMIVAVSPIFFG